MASNKERGLKACSAMATLGFPKKKAATVIKRLLNLFDGNWEPIEEENYRILIDAILEDQSDGPMPATTPQETDVDRIALPRHMTTDEDPVPHSSTWVMQDYQHPSPSAPASQYDMDVSDNESSLIKRPRMSSADRVHEWSPQPFATKGMSVEPASPRPTTQAIMALPVPVVHQADDHGGPSASVTCNRDKGLLLESPQDALLLKEPKPESKIDVSAAPVIKHLNIGGGKNMLIKHCKTRDMLTSGADARVSIVNYDQNLDSSQHAVKNGVGSTVQNTQHEPLVELDVASSTMGEVKMSLKCKFDPSEVCISLDEVFKMIEDKCCRSYKILPPDFSIGKLMNEVCQYVAESGDVQSKAQSSGGSLQEKAVETNAPFVKPIACQHDFSGIVVIGSSAPESSEPIFQNWIVPYQSELLSKQRPPHDVADISKGEERVRIPIVNEFGNESCPPLFYYIRKNLAFQSAYIKTSLARIGDEDCCADCSGNCLLSSRLCACARSTGGDFAYTPEGLVRAAFIDESIAANHFPEKHNKFYCEACPLERSKIEASSGPCKGHLARKFIKECWSKCGCGIQCGNRVIQRGITCNLEVFFTSEGKGWGLRTLDGLPKGAFICEYIGEVLTSSELHERTVQNAKNAKHVHQVLLDASWGSEGASTDEEALCLDPTFYGNVGRFVNHRCYDANLVLIPVEVETPDHHYYHLALFTAKKIEASEELTWDYGIDFDATDSINKAFRCMCGSKYCRDPKNSNDVAEKWEKGQGRTTWRQDIGPPFLPRNSSSPYNPEPVEREAALASSLAGHQRSVIVLAWPRLHHISPSFLVSSRSCSFSHSAQYITATAEKRKEAHGCVCVIRGASSSDVVQLRVRRGPAGHVFGVDAAPVGTAPSDAREDGQRKRGQGHLRAPGGGDAQYRRTQALQPAQGKGHRAALPGDHRVLQDHRRRPEAEAGIDPTSQEERREARIPCLTSHSPLIFSTSTRELSTTLLSFLGVGDAYSCKLAIYFCSGDGAITSSNRVQFQLDG